MSRRLLQITNLILALFTIILAGASVILGTNSPIYGSSVISAIPALDSNLRFAGGIGLGLGIALLWITPQIERHTTIFRLVWICAFLGGLGRLVSFALVGQPPISMLIFTLIEVPGVPLLMWWQNVVAGRSVA